jgi:DMSO/TMAO reductase YedYZ heme-binding membrane subunit
MFPLLTLHAALYLTFFTLSRLLAWRLRSSDVQLGITGILLVLVLWVTSSSVMALGGLRRRVGRRTFYVMHVSLVGALLAVAYYHVVYAQKYVLQALAIYAVDVVSYTVEKGRG